MASNFNSSKITSSKTKKIVLLKELRLNVKKENKILKLENINKIQVGNVKDKLGSLQKNKS